MPSWPYLACQWAHGRQGCKLAQPLAEGQHAADGVGRGVAGVYRGAHGQGEAGTGPLQDVCEGLEFWRAEEVG